MKFKIKGHEVKVLVNGQEQESLVKKAKLSDKGITLEKALRDFKAKKEKQGGKGA